jgi:hypothetical protein
MNSNLSQNQNQKSNYCIIEQNKFKEHEFKIVLGIDRLNGFYVQVVYNLENSNDIIVLFTKVINVDLKNLENIKLEIDNAINEAKNLVAIYKSKLETIEIIFNEYSSKYK